MAGGAHGAVEARLDDAETVCDREGAQLTDLRRHVLRLLLEADGPATAYQLLDRLKETRKSAAPPTVYRALDFLLEHRLIHKLERLNAFVPCIDVGQHEHSVQFLICRRCGTVTELEDRGASDALERAAARAGFHPEKAVVEVTGTCAACAAGA